MRVWLTGVFIVVFAGVIWLDGGAQSGDPVVSGAHRFQKVAADFVTDAVKQRAFAPRHLHGLKHIFIVADADQALSHR